MKTNKNILILLMILTFISIAFVYLTNTLGGYNGLLGNILYLIPPLFSVGCGIYAFYRFGWNSSHGKSMLFISLGLLFFLIGEITWTLFDFVFHIDPYPSLADVFYLIAYPSFFVGFLLAWKETKIDWTTRKLTLAFLISIVLGVIVFYFNIFMSYNPDESLWNNVIAILYGVGDFVIVFINIYILMVMFEYKNGKLFFPWLSIFVGFILILLADVIFSIFRDGYNEKIWIFKQIDLIWAAGYLAIAFGLFQIGYLVHLIQNSILNRIETRETNEK